MVGLQEQISKEAVQQAVTPSSEGKPVPPYHSGERTFLENITFGSCIILDRFESAHAEVEILK